MTFDFYTPIETIDDDLWLDFPERDRMLDKLMALKRIYRDFLVLPERTFELMKSENCRAVIDNCLFSKKSFAFGRQGELKEKCMMGPKADCDRCGCVVPFYMPRWSTASASSRTTLATWPAGSLARPIPSRRGSEDSRRAIGEGDSAADELR